MFERASRGERALLIQVNDKNPVNQVAAEEFKSLAEAAGAQIIHLEHVVLQKFNSATLIGKGKVDEMSQVVEADEIELVIVSHPLSPVQERNLEEIMQCRVFDRRTLILDIFSQRAKSYEGQLQVELAQLGHMATRLVRGWTHLERQKGGIGMRGPGETQLETDRRLLADRVKLLKKRLKNVDKRRAESRKSRRQSGTPQIALVGYTNAGKSTLFNHLTHAHVYVKDQLFATLDPTMRKLELPGYGTIVLADTVGFVADLPHDLVAAFQSTLQEAKEADLLVHVIDGSDPEWMEKANDVRTVLADIKADHIPQLEVFNKADLIENEGDISRDVLSISAVTGQGVDGFLTALVAAIDGSIINKVISLTPAEGQLRAQLYEVGAVQSEEINEQGGFDLHIQMSQLVYERMFGLPERKKEDWE